MPTYKIQFYKTDDPRKKKHIEITADNIEQAISSANWKLTEYSLRDYSFNENSVCKVKERTDIQCVLFADGSTAANEK